MHCPITISGYILHLSNYPRLKVYQDARINQLNPYPRMDHKSKQPNTKNRYYVIRYIIAYMRKSFDRCFVTVYLPERIIEALSTRLSKPNNPDNISRSAYISKAVKALLISEGYQDQLCQEKPAEKPTTPPTPAREPLAQPTCSGELAPQ